MDGNAPTSADAMGARGLAERERMRAVLECSRACAHAAQPGSVGLPPCGVNQMKFVCHESYPAAQVPAQMWAGVGPVPSQARARVGPTKHSVAAGGPSRTRLEHEERRARVRERALGEEAQRIAAALQCPRATWTTLSVRGAAL
jgi:hypothetical protein